MLQDQDEHQQFQLPPASSTTNTTNSSQQLAVHAAPAPSPLLAQGGKNMMVDAEVPVTGLEQDHDDNDTQQHEYEQQDGTISNVHEMYLCDANDQSGIYSGPLYVIDDEDTAVSSSNSNQDKNSGKPHGSGGIMLYSPSTTEATRTSTKNIPSNHDPVVKYSGEWWQGHWHGTGEYWTKNGDYYQGSLCFGQKHGQGYYVFADGRRYRGTFRGNQRHGHGCYQWNESIIYEGTFVNNVRQGVGKFVDDIAHVEYSGEFFNGVYQGYGTYRWQDNMTGELRVYTGNFFDGKPHGEGREVYPDGTVRHDGLWKMGKPMVDPTIVLDHVSSHDDNKRKTGTLGNNGCTTMVVHNHLWKGENLPSAIYRGLWNVQQQVPDGTGTAEFQDGEWQRYDGFFTLGEFHGFGRLLFTNGDTYDGNFIHGDRHGSGIYRWSDGRQYTGAFEKNIRQGDGTLVYANGDYYEGSFVLGRREGQGRFVFLDGTTYDGEWKNGMYHGLGTLTALDGSAYTGSFFEGRAHGVGTETDPLGVVTYQGEWVHGQRADLYASQHSEQDHDADDGNVEEDKKSDPMDGKGQMRVSSTSRVARTTAAVAAASASLVTSPVQLDRDSADPDICEATVEELVQDEHGSNGHYTGIVNKTTRKPHGVGRLVYLDGKRVHEGFWRNGEKCGHGRCFFLPQGDIHEGTYKSGLRDGPGRYKWQDGRVYEGMYSNDARTGYGVFLYPNGDKYEGMFKEGKRCGEGQFVFDQRNGYYQGEWSSNRYHGRGRLVWDGGYVYEGEFCHGTFHGIGVKKDPKGNNLQHGVWVKGKFQQSQLTTKDNESEQVTNENEDDSGNCESGLLTLQSELSPAGPPAEPVT